MTAGAAVAHDSDVYVGTCWECQGPCAFYKGDIHGWRCRACIDRYLDEAQARWASKSQKARDKVIRNVRSMVHEHNTDGSTAMTPGCAANDRRRGGGMAAGLAASTSIADNRISAHAS
ncbi:hypothetical protein H7I77_01845 [Mycolicibacterium novocastrense]|uniref:Uncharacterized protein n=1 Tax=Mycolicibacterium novocastrense TaxID=59813 RepID=A0AAW5SD12_MYCNV|nr:hypothetical protein [Mycolicibacterium novocastrense]MCV7022094.1 hypothetical protein [Mycolicibacterium novocastrense]GAT09373.1 uncharacterized protein RMCN_2506 [Mycolicibacterium novocastrense]